MFREFFQSLQDKKYMDRQPRIMNLSNINKQTRKHSSMLLLYFVRYVHTNINKTCMQNGLIQKLNRNKERLETVSHILQ